MITRTVTETEAFAEEFAKGINLPKTILLFGDLGAGKTAFTRGLANGLGYAGRVSSPTFTLVHEYKGTGCMIYHFDLYRLNDEEELYDIGFYEYLERSDAVCVIEWPDKFLDCIGENVVKVRLSYTETEGEREIEVEE